MDNYSIKTVLIGEYQHIIDDKNRMAIPAKFRELISRGCVVTRGLDHCLFLFTKEEWTKLAEKISALPIAQANTRAFSRLMLSGAMQLELDTQGRIVLPEYLKEYAGLKKKIVIAGVSNRLEVWDEEEWKRYKHATEQQSNQIAEGMANLGI